MWERLNEAASAIVIGIIILVALVGVSNILGALLGPMF